MNLLFERNYQASYLIINTQRQCSSLQKPWTYQTS